MRWIVLVLMLLAPVAEAGKPNVFGPGGVGSGLNDALEACAAPRSAAAALQARTEAARRFRWAEFLFRNADLRFRGPETFEADLERWQRDLRRARRAYVYVIEAGDPDLAVAALVRMAEHLRRSTLAMLRVMDAYEAPAEVPAKAESGEIYVDSYEDPSTQELELALAAAERLHVENAWTAHARDMLGGQPKSHRGAESRAPNESGGTHSDPAAP